LKAMQAKDAHPGREAIFVHHRAMVPQLAASFLLQEEKGSRERRRANLLLVPHGQAFTGEALRRRFPTGLPAKHVYWIFRRLLLALWGAHLHGIVHGAVTADHLLVYPELQPGAHHLVLLDWCASAQAEKEKVPAVDPKWEKWLPLDMLCGEPADPSMDLYMAASTALTLLGDQPMPEPVKAALLTLKRERPDRRPRDAERFYTEFERLIEAAHGPRRFCPLEVP
jgi:hypothetical protein